MASRTPTPTQANLKEQRVALQEEVSSLMREADTLSEGLDQVRAMLQREDRNWVAVFGGGNEDDGLDLDNLKEWSRKLRNSVVGAPWMKRGLSLRSSYVWQGGMQYGNIPSSGKGKSKNVQTLINHPLNQRNFFGPIARRKREGCLYHDGIALWVGDNTTKQVHPIPLNEITGDLRDPDHNADVWAYRRSWTETNLSTAEKTQRVEWYFTDTFYEHRVATITRGSNKPEPVSQTHTAFDMVANGMEGFAYGSPDALAAQIWNGITRDLYMDGVTMSQAMSTFALKATVSTKAGGDRTTMRLASSKGAGQTAVLGGVNDLVPLSTAGKGYDFETLRSVVAIIATALDVSSIALTSDPGAAGSSYGSASTLDLPTRLAMEARRQEHIQLDARVLRWMGAPDATVYFEPLDDGAETYREVQAVILKWNTGLYSAEEAKKQLEAIAGREFASPVPDGVMLPNNEKFKDTLTNDGQDAATPSTAAPGQGRSDKTGGQDAAGNDLRNDGVSK